MKIFGFRSRLTFKYLILVPVIVVVILNIQLITQIKELNGFYGNRKATHDVDASNTASQNDIADKNSGVDSNLIYSYDKNARLDDNPNNRTSNFNYTNLNELKKLIFEHNLRPFIRNKHFINGLLEEEAKLEKKTALKEAKTLVNVLLNRTNVSTSTTSTTTSFYYKPPKFLVILIQIHSRLNYLKELINSLKDTKHIEQTLVVFSHDVYDPEMNKLIESIDFCATLQIFYPYSMQLYPDKFPGQDPNDCPKSIDKAK